MKSISPSLDMTQFASTIKQWGYDLGFQGIGITDLDLTDYIEDLKKWLAKNYHGEMDYMAKYGLDRAKPEAFVPYAKRVIMVRMDYLPPDAEIRPIMQDKTLGVISRYSLGRDYHKVLRKRLKKLAEKINQQLTPHQYRVFTDTGPIMEKPLAEKAGLGWIGKNTLLINSKGGSWFFLGSLLTDLPLPVDQPASFHCGSCFACSDICPTKAIIGPKQIDARRCISYLTIEYKGVIPEEFRKPMGNRIYGCDDCQLICPWNKFARYTNEDDFYARKHLKAPTLLELFEWSEEQFLSATEGTAIRRIGYECWLRNVAIGLGNAPFDQKILVALKSKYPQTTEMVQEHINWAINQQLEKAIVAAANA